MKNNLPEQTYGLKSFEGSRVIPRPKAQKKAFVPPTRILWAVDPFVDDDFGLKEGAVSAKTLANIWNCPVEPVYILSPEGLDFPGDFSSEWVKSFRPQLEKSLAEKSSFFGGGSFLEPKVIVSYSGGKRKDLKALLNYAKKNGSAPLVLTTHGRSGFKRWMLGSFAETALLVAQTPLLIVPPEHELTKLEVAFFPTNFSRASKVFIKKQASWLQQKNIRTVIYHQLKNIVDPFIQSGMTLAGGGWVSFQAMMQEESARRQKDGEKLCKELAEKGLDARFIMGSPAESLEHGVVEAAKSEQADIIGLLTESDALNARLVGSLARQLSRSAPCPLWIQHS